MAYTFDELMHLGQHDGRYYAMGYCGAGVGTSSYFGMHVGRQMLGLKEGSTALYGLAFQTFRPGRLTGVTPGSWRHRWRISAGAIAGRFENIAMAVPTPRFDR